MNPNLASVLLLISVILASGCTTEQPAGTNTYSPQECIDLGGRPVNIVGGDTCYGNETNIGSVVGFISPNICCVPSADSARLTLEQAVGIAGASACMEMGSLTDSHFYNPNSHTWWIDMDMKPEFAKDYCSPACVVSEETGEAEINWRCTGALP
jgi:hypothetical protein